jgi:Rrf2 family iron-sulfur cluster assembly transcriptional regulator
MTTYAVQAMCDLASQPAGTVVALHDIAERQGIKTKYLERIFSKLHRGGLIKSKKGPGGGYYLERSVNDIRIGEIMNAVGESSAPVRCLSAQDENYCSRQEACVIRPYWQKMKQTIDGFLYSSTLSDIMKTTKR